MKILFVLYNNFKCNSAAHVHNFANAMSEKGHHCVVAVPDKKETSEEVFGGSVNYLAVNYNDLLNPDNEDLINGVDIIHAWTPRENVRKMSSHLKKKNAKCRLIIHMEDNEEVILSKNTPFPLFFLTRLPEYVIKRVIPDTISHPVHYKTFLNEADGITIIMDTLCNFVSDTSKCEILWPIIDLETFSPIIKHYRHEQRLGIKTKDIVLVYTGNVHAANLEEVYELYMAVGLANREGLNVKLIRTGIDCCAFIKKKDEWVRQYCVELGYVDREDIPKYLSLADILIQPGKPDPFNDYRLPSKIPEFLAMGKPVAIPKTNIGRFLKDDREAIMMAKGDRHEILNIIKKVCFDKRLSGLLSIGSRQFAEKNFSKDVIVEKLDFFYKSKLNP